MALPGPRSPGDAAGVLPAIGRAGLVGLTPKQLAATTDLPLPVVQSELARLASGKRVVKVGRDLWVAREFAGDPSADPTFQGPAWYTEQFERAFDLRPAPFAGPIQFNPNERLPVHRWWSYVQGFSAEFVERVLAEYAVGPGDTVLDPFAGSGTVPVVARRAGAASVGIELMPVAAFVARAKQLWSVSPASLRQAAHSVLRNEGLPPTLSPPFLTETRRQFPGAVLRSLLRIKEDLAGLPDDGARTLLKLCFAGILVESSHLKRSPCLGYAKREGLSARTPYALFQERVETIATDLEGLNGTPVGPEARIVQGDAKDPWLPPESVDLAITSPPYVNGMDYVNNYKIELAWLDLAESYEDLRTLRSSLVACDNVSRSVIQGHRPGPAAAHEPWLTAISARIQERLAQKPGYRRGDMAGVVTKYFDDLASVLHRVYDALRPGGRFVVVNGDSFIAGTYVPGDLLFARLAHAQGFEVERFQVARARRSGQRRSFRLRESVLTLLRPGPRAAPGASRPLAGARQGSRPSGGGPPTLRAGERRDQPEGGEVGEGEPSRNGRVRYRATASRVFAASARVAAMALSHA